MGSFLRQSRRGPALPLIAERGTRAEQGPAIPWSARDLASSPALAHGLTYGVELLPRHPIEAARAGATARIPLIIGTNRREASLFARDKPPMLPTTPDTVDRYFEQLTPEVRARVLAAYPALPHRRALEMIGADAMFVAPTWAFADAYSAHAPTYAYRFDHTPATLRVTGLGAVHGSEIVHILHTYGSYLGRRLHPLGRWRTPAVGRRMQHTCLEFTAAAGGARPWSKERPCYETRRRTTGIIRSQSDVLIDDPDDFRRSAWHEVY
jgi:para-nitrobenzyl esterase